MLDLRAGALVLFLGICLAVLQEISCAKWCHLCEEENDPKNCNHVIQCEKNQTCAAVRFGDTVMPESYSLACVDDMFCPNLSLWLQPFHPGRAMTCSQCCPETGCNAKLCLQGTNSGLAALLHCFQCDDTSDPQSCSNSTTCSSDQMCGIEVNGNGNYTLGCKQKHDCNSLDPKTGVCCDSNLCNNLRDDRSFPASSMHAVTCYKCDEIKDPRNCTNEVTCPDTSLEASCYVEELVTINNEVVYNLGCEERLACSLHEDPELSDLSLERREGPRLTTCIRCCEGSTCNNHFCKDLCSQNPCENNSTCVMKNRTEHTCECKPGFTGKTCGTEINECASSPCQNGGQCHNVVNGFHCVCLPGYTGSTCQTDIDECASQPCQHGGTCHDGINAFSCHCLQGTSGHFCETDVNECASDPCENGGKCEDRLGGFHCACTHKFEGETCETPNNKSVCLSCKGVNSPLSCTNWTLCQPGEICSSDKIQLAGEVKYDLGCRTQQFCDFYKVTAGVGRRQLHPITLCSDCCSGDQCNRQLCFEKPNGTICQDCTDVIHPEDCFQVKVCDPTQACSVQRTIDITTSDVRFQMGCSSRQSCDRLSSGLSGLPAGRRDVNSVTQCFKCCHDNSCSLKLCIPVDHCKSSPCQNGGSCNNFEDGYNCSCPPGYRGRDCETETACLSGPCRNNGTCLDLPDGSFVCRCTPEYTDHTCSTMLQCHSSPCHNNGTCLEAHQITHPNPFTCICPPSYSGPRCQHKSPCLSSPCQNGGTCLETHLYQNYNCTCPPGFSGRHCETESPCLSSPCQNGGTCLETHLFQNYNCTCPPGFSGRHCDTVHACSSNPCQNGGTCEDHGSNYRCLCSQHFYGQQCQGVHACDAVPCQNGGTCVETLSGFSCDCQAPYSGAKCEIGALCRDVICQNKGTCNQATGSCQCPAGFTGHRCEKVDLCLGVTCQNKGTCNQATGSCHCTAGFTGHRCETVDLCHGNPCHHGNCIPANGSCACSAGFTGDKCQHADLCFGVTCEHGGKCNTSSGSCVCADGFAGDRCERVCQYVPLSHLGCSSHEDIVFLLEVGKAFNTTQIWQEMTFLHSMMADGLLPMKGNRYAVLAYGSNTTVLLNFTADVNQSVSLLSYLNALSQDQSSHPDLSSALAWVGTHVLPDARPTASPVLVAVTREDGAAHGHALRQELQKLQDRCVSTNFLLLKRGSHGSGVKDALGQVIPNPELHFLEVDNAGVLGSAFNCSSKTR